MPSKSDARAICVACNTLVTAEPFIAEALFADANWGKRAISRRSFQISTCCAVSLLGQPAEIEKAAELAAGMRSSTVTLRAEEDIGFSGPCLDGAAGAMRIMHADAELPGLTPPADSGSLALGAL